MADGFSVAWDGLQGLLGAIDRVAAQADAAAKEVVTRSAAVVEAKAKANFSGAHKKGEPHVGGSQPNIVTGTLRRSIRHDPVTRLGTAEYGTTVGPRTVYARRVELGYRGKGAHPYFTPAARESQAAIRAIAAATWARFLKP